MVYTSVCGGMGHRERKGGRREEKRKEENEEEIIILASVFMSTVSCIRQCTKCFTYGILFHLRNTITDRGVIIPIL